VVLSPGHDPERGKRESIEVSKTGHWIDFPRC
jgi:hypothetical protein